MTIPSPAGIPAWEWLAGLVIIGTVTIAVAWLQSRPVRKTMRQVAADAEAAATDAAAAAMTVKTAADDVANVKHEVHPNSGKSLRDKVDQIAALLELIKATQDDHGERLAEQSADIGGIRAELRQERVERSELSSRLTHLEQQH